MKLGKVITSRLFLGASALIAVLNCAPLNVAHGQNEYEAVPLLLTWTPPTLNEDKSCLTGSDPACSNDLSGFKIYRASALTGSDVHVFYAFTEGSTNSFIDRDLIPGLNYHYVITSIDKNGNESGETIEVKAKAIVPTEDDDSDGILNGVDNCPEVANVDQADSNGDGQGDACGVEILKDEDSDGVPDRTDNCPSIANSDQADADLDGMGDACQVAASRVVCGKTKTATLSSVALLNDSKAFLIDPATMNTAGVNLVAGSLGLIGDFNPAQEGPPDFGELELAEPSAMPDGKLSWEITSMSALYQTPFGNVGDTAIGCYIDNDNQLDLGAYDKKRFIVKSSASGEEIEIPFAPLFGKVKNVTCADFDGDGKDELVLLHVPPKTKPAKGKKAKKPVLTVSVYKIAEEKVLKSMVADLKAEKVLLADTNGDGKREICTTLKAEGGKSVITCSKGGVKRLIVPPIKDLTAGQYDSKKKGEGFVVLGKDGKVYIANRKGAPTAVISSMVGISDKRGGGKTLRLAKCR